MTILFVPVDSRPVSTAWPRRMAECGGVKLAMPPARLLGGLSEPGDTTGIARWLLSRARSGADTLIVSVDSLLFGGLVFSREPLVTTERALQGLELLRQLKHESPEMRILAFQSVLRDATTVRDEKSLAEWREMMKGRRYPEWFTELRKRNLEVSIELVKMAGQGILDCLVLAKEDTSPKSPFLDELDRLRREIAVRGARNRAFVTTGTDEAMLLLHARAVCAARGARPRFVLAGNDKRWMVRVPPYEHQPLSRTIREQIELVGGVIAEKAKGSEIEIVVHFHSETPDIYLRQLEGRRRASSDGEAVERTVALVKERLDIGRRAALLDCAFANGGDAQLVRRLLEERLFLRLISYAGWNTHANRAGGLIAHVASAHVAESQHAGGRAAVRRRINRHVRLMVERAAHDCVYSTIVRGRLAALSDAAGNCKDRTKSENALSEEMTGETRRFFRTAFGAAVETPWDAAIVCLHDVSVTRARFPWGRLFEIDCRCDPDFSLIEMD